jgi:hypothetical protein
LVRVSLDATRVEEGAEVSDIAGSPLWPQGQPDKFQRLWQEMKVTLHAAEQDWQVWTIWYDDRLTGYPFREEERELAYVRIDEPLWAKGPAIVNAVIKLLIAEHEPSPPITGAAAQHHPEIIAAWQSADAAPQMPRYAPQSADTPPAPIENVPSAVSFGWTSKATITLVSGPEKAGVSVQRRRGRSQEQDRSVPHSSN